MPLVKLNRSRLFMTGLIIIFFYLVLNRINFTKDTSLTKGVVIGLKGWSRRGPAYSPPMVLFRSRSGEEITFHGETNSAYMEGDTVPVIYKNDDPSNAHINTFTGFWLGPLIYSILPLMILTAVVFSFMNERDFLIIDLGRFLFWKKRADQPESHSFIYFKQLSKNPQRIDKKASGPQ